MCYKYNIVLELAKFENSFLALILSNPLQPANPGRRKPTIPYWYPWCLINSAAKNLV